MPVHRLVATSLLSLPLLLTACMGTFSTELHNQTAAPLYAQIRQRTDDGRLAIQSDIRMGPGDRAAMGPVSIPVGRAVLTLQIRPDGDTVWTTDLRPGTTVFGITPKTIQSAPSIEVRELSSSPPTALPPTTP